MMPGAAATTVFHENVQDVSGERQRGPSSPLVMGAQISPGALSAGWCFREREVTMPGWNLCSVLSVEPLSQVQGPASIVEGGNQQPSKDDGQIQMLLREPATPAVKQKDVQQLKLLNFRIVAAPFVLLSHPQISKK